jgi:PadR family transcriptional regulator PadR
VVVFVRSQTLKGHLDMLLLAALNGDPAHGYAVLERLRTRSVMHDGRGRRVHSLTDRGTRTLADYQQEWRQFSAGVTRIVEGTG